MEKKASKRELIDTLRPIIKSYPPAFSRHKNIIRAFQLLIDRHEAIVTFLDFEMIYTPGKPPEKMADEILKRGKRRIPLERSRERGFNEENKLLLMAQNLLTCPDKVIKRFKVRIEGRELYSLLRITHHLRTNGVSIDKFMDGCGYADEARRLIAEGLQTFYEVGIVFRTALYRDYSQKRKTIEKMPEARVYYEDVIKHGLTKRKGKKPIKEIIERDIDEFRDYLLNEGYEHNRDRTFYDTKRFRYLTFLVIGIGTILDAKLTKSEKKKLSFPRKLKRSSTFSVDKYLDEARRKPRGTHAVGFNTLPLLKSEGASHTSSDA